MSIKNLLIMRHAKSDWADSSLTDFDRPLNKRGQKAAPFMGNVLKTKNKVPDLIISSPAQRAKSTAENVALSINYTSKIQFEKDFYFGYIDEIIHILQQVNNKHNNILIIGHNPTFESLVEILTTENIPASMPTAAVASLLFEMNSWDMLNRGLGKLEWLLKPKELMS